MRQVRHSRLVRSLDSRDMDGRESIRLARLRPDSSESSISARFWHEPRRFRGNGHWSERVRRRSWCGCRSVNQIRFVWEALNLSSGTLASLGFDADVQDVLLTSLGRNQ